VCVVARAVLLDVIKTMARSHQAWHLHDGWRVHRTAIVVVLASPHQRGLVPRLLAAPNRVFLAVKNPPLERA